MINLDEQYLTVKRSISYKSVRRKFEIDLACTNDDGSHLTNSGINCAYRRTSKEILGLLGHSDIRTTMNIYAHASREAKRIMDKVTNGNL